MAPSARAAAPGSLSSTFGSAGVASAPSDTRLFATALQSDGKVLAVGESGASSSAGLLVARFTPSGQLDGSFGSGGIAAGPSVAGAGGSIGRAVAVQPDGKIVVVGQATDTTGNYTRGLVVERFNASGTPDGSFGSGGVVEELTGASFGYGNAVAIRPNGDILAAGSATAAGSGGTAPRVAVIQLTPQGALDTGFAGGGVDILDFGAYSTAQGLALQGDGKLVLVGSQAPGGQVTNALVARLTVGGSPDPAFAGGAGAYAHQYAQGAASSNFNAVTLQANGDLVAAGAASIGNTGVDALLARFTAAGAPDASFGSGGAVYEPAATNYSPSSGQAPPGANGLTLAFNGDLVAAGTAANGGASSGALWAFNSSGGVDSTFGSGGVAVLTGSNGNTEFGGVALAPNGDFLAAGDTGGVFNPFVGILARYVGFAPPPAPTPTPTPTPKPKPPAFKLSVSGVPRSASARSLARHPVSVNLSCNAACTGHVALLGTAAVARRLHILTQIRRCTKVHGHNRCKTSRSYRALTLSPRTLSLTRAGSRRVVLRLASSFITALKRHPGAQLTLQISATPHGSRHGPTIRKSITFTR